MYKDLQRTCTAIVLLIKPFVSCRSLRRLGLVCLSSLYIKPWSNRPASSRKWRQVKLALRLALGGQTDSQGSSQVHEVTKKNNFKADSPLFHWLIRG